MEFPALPGSLAKVREAVARHQAVGGWTHPVRIVAVTKTHGPEAVRAAVAAGLTDVGENRVQEAMEKQDALAGVPVAWHLIGTLQRNKARQAAGRFALIHSVDRLDLAAELDRRALPAGERQAVLVQVNCSDEPQKGGVEPDGLPPLLEAIGRPARPRGDRAHDDERADGRRGGAAAGVPPAARAARRGGARGATACPSSRWACPGTTQWRSRKGRR